MMLKFNPDQYAQLGRASYLRRLIALIREHGKWADRAPAAS